MTINTKNILIVCGTAGGFDFIHEAYALGCKVYVLTTTNEKNALWPRECIEEFYYFDENQAAWSLNGIMKSIRTLVQTVTINRIFAVSDIDYEKAHAIREHLRIAGYVDTFIKYQIDRLAVKMRAAEVGISTPDFVHILNYDLIRSFISKTQFPYVIKPRFTSDPYGIRKVENEYEMWDAIGELGERQSDYYMEKFIPGHIFNAYSLMYNKEAAYTINIQFGLPSMEIAENERVFSAWTVTKGTEDEIQISQVFRKICTAYGLNSGYFQVELIKDARGKFYFLDITSRMRNFQVFKLIEAASGLNLLREWARLEVLNGQSRFIIPPRQNYTAGMVSTLARQQFPDLDSYNDSEIVWKSAKEYKAEIIFKSELSRQVSLLVDDYTFRFYNDFFTSGPMELSSTA